jgi:hypothetical protein
MLSAAAATGFHHHPQSPSKERQVLGGFGQEPSAFPQVQRRLPFGLKSPMDHDHMAETPIRVACMAKNRQDASVVLGGTHQVQH